MEERKYTLTSETKVVQGHTLYRIRALKSFNTIIKGDLGGFIESEENLYQEGTCWVYHNAMVYEEAKVSGEAKLFCRVSVFGKAEISGRAKLSEDVKV